MAEDVVLTELEIEENDLLTRAIAYAVAMHRGGLRKGTSIPYIVHPLEVLNNLFLMNADKKLMAAGVLHDTVEDTAATMEDIVVLFGKEVAALCKSSGRSHGVYRFPYLARTFRKSSLQA